jgi:predicted ester cyclase
VVFPDWRFDLVSLIAEGDRVAAHMPYSGTFANAINGIAPTGAVRPGRRDGHIPHRRSRIAEAWEVYDETGMWRRVGVNTHAQPYAKNLQVRISRS